ncbi:hypothetical protein K438DRAFT_248378 [Mycena galopus ATCC 62051]|nr:hypothetical protein K438DRAFT_248378 [Mycena galopus ATCC 62051]
MSVFHFLTSPDLLHTQHLRFSRHLRPRMIFFILFFKSSDNDWNNALPVWESPNPSQLTKDWSTLDFNLWTKLWGRFLSFFPINMYLISYSRGFNVSPPLPPTFRSTLTTVELNATTSYQRFQYLSTTFLGSGIDQLTCRLLSCCHVDAFCEPETEILVYIVTSQKIGHSGTLLHAHPVLNSRYSSRHSSNSNWCCTCVFRTIFRVDKCRRSCFS